MARLISLAFEASAVLSVLVVALVGTALTSMLMVAVSLKLLIDAAIQHSSGGVVAGAIVAGLGLAGNVAWLPLGASVSLRLQERIQAALDRRLMTHVARIPTLELYDRPELAQKLQLLMNDDRFPIGGALVTLTSVVAYVGLLAVASVAMGVQHPLLGLVPMAVVPLLWVGYRADRAWERTRERTAGDQQLAHELFRLCTTPDAGKELRIFDVGDDILERHAAAEARFSKALNRASWNAALVRSASWLVFAAGYVAAVLVVVQRAVDGQATAGDVVLVITLALPIVMLAGTAGPYLSVLSQLNAAAERLRWLSDLAAEASRPAPATSSPPTELLGSIRLEDVTFAYPGASTPTLTDVSLAIPAGSVLALVGENGAGKSTLVKLLCGLYEPTAGRIVVDGFDLRDIDHEDWRSRICAGFQDFVHFELLAGDSIGVGDLPRRSQPEAIATAIQRAGSGDVLVRLADGLDTQLGRSWTDGAQLSTGQWQKIALSRGLMRDDPLVVVLDEPTAALDPSAEHQLFQRFAATVRAGRDNGAVTVLVSHRFSTVRFADLIAVVDEGRVTDVGSHDELMARGGTYAELYEIQMRNYQ